MKILLNDKIEEKSKIIFVSVSEHCASSGEKNRPLLRGGGVCMSLTGTGPIIYVSLT